MNIIEINNLSKVFGKKKETVEALKNISFHVKAGCIFGLIGPDGAGKTTLHRVLTTLLLPTFGTASVMNYDVKKDWKKIREKVGYMPGKFSLYLDLSVEENLDFFAKIYQTSIEENYSLIKDIYQQLEPFKERKAGNLSGGMKQKLALCCSLIHKPNILFLDEPTTGVDPVSRKEFWNILKTIQKQGITTLVSTPYMDEAELCDQVALIQKGEILTVAQPNHIKMNFKKPLLAAKANNMLQLLKVLNNKVPHIEKVYPFGEYHHVVLKKNSSINDLENLLKHQTPELEIKEIDPDIEDCFIDLMSNSDNSNL